MAHENGDLTHIWSCVSEYQTRCNTTSNRERTVKWTYRYLKNRYNCFALETRTKMEFYDRVIKKKPLHIKPVSC